MPDLSFVGTPVDALSIIRKETMRRPTGEYREIIAPALLHLYHHGYLGDMLEIGVAQGNTQRHLARIARDMNRLHGTNVRAWGIDRADRRNLNENEMIRMDQLLAELYLEDCRPHIVLSDSTDCRDLAGIFNLVFLFVDGGHDYATTLSDLQTFVPCVLPGGIIAVHDAEPGFDPNRALTDFLSSYTHIADYFVHDPPDRVDPAVWYGVHA